jgi:hypothetical protein
VRVRAAYAACERYLPVHRVVSEAPDAVVVEIPAETVGWLIERLRSGLIAAEEVE